MKYNVYLKWEKPKKTREKPKKNTKNKTFQINFGLELKVGFFLVFLEFFWFWDAKNKKPLNLFGFLMIKVPKKTQGKPTFYNDMMELIHVKTKKP